MVRRVAKTGQISRQVRAFFGEGQLLYKAENFLAPAKTSSFQLLVIISTLGIDHPIFMSSRITPGLVEASCTYS